MGRGASASARPGSALASPTSRLRRGPRVAYGSLALAFGNPGLLAATPLALANRLKFLAESLTSQTISFFCLSSHLPIRENFPPIRGPSPRNPPSHPSHAASPSLPQMNLTLMPSGVHSTT